MENPPFYYAICFYDKKRKGASGETLSYVFLNPHCNDLLDKIKEKFKDDPDYGVEIEIEKRIPHYP